MFSRFQRNPVVPYKGLVNQGSTCYLNSVLQVLFMTTDFREAVQRSPPGSLDGCLKELFDDLREHDGLTYNITKALGITNGRVQADAAECFEKILRSLTNPEASRIFQGVLTVKNKCSTCNTETCDDNPCWSLPLEMVDSVAEYKVEDGINQYFHPSKVGGHDKLFCEDCNSKTDSTIKLELKHHPEVLTLLLKRFKVGYDYKYFSKVERRVDIPRILRIESQTYELYAFVEHLGSLKYGHYTATIKSQKEEEWYNFDDTKVKRCYQFYQLDERETSQGAYLLFYKKISVEEALNEENNKACEPESSETLGAGTHEPHKSDKETVKSKTCEMKQSCDSTERQETERKEEEKMNQKIIIVKKEEDLKDQFMMNFKKEEDLKDHFRISSKKEEDLKDQCRMSLKKEEDLTDQLRMSLKKEEDLKDQLRMSLKKEEDLKDNLRMSLKKEEDLTDQLRMSLKKEEDLKDHLRMSLKKEEDLKDQLRMSLKKEEDLKDHLRMSLKKEEDLKDQIRMSLKKQEDLTDQCRMSLKKEEDLTDQCRMSLKKEEDLKDHLRMSLKKEEDLKDQIRMSLRKQEDLTGQIRINLKKKEDNVNIQTRTSAEKNKWGENIPEHQAKASKHLTLYDLSKSPIQSSGGRDESRVRSLKMSQEPEGENRRRSTQHEQQSEEKSTENKTNPENQTERESIQSNINTGAVEVPRADLRAERVHNSNVSTLVKCLESSNYEVRGQSREEPSNTSVEHEGSRKNSCIQQRNDSRDAENKQRKNLHLPPTGGPTLTNDGSDSVQRSRGSHRSSMSVILQNQSSGKKCDFVTKRTQNEDILDAEPKRKCNGETGDNQQNKHSDEGMSDRNRQNESTVKRPASSPDDRKERTTIMSNVVKPGGSHSPCNREDHQTEHSKIIQQDATYVQQRCPNVCLHPNFQQRTTKMTPGHTAPSACDPVSCLTNNVQSMTLTDMQTHDPTNMSVKTGSRDQQIQSNTHECGLNVASPNHDHFHYTYPNSQNHTEYSHHYSEHNMLVNTDSRSQQMLSNSQCWYDYNMAYSVPVPYYSIYQNVQGNNAYSYPPYSGHMSAENVTSCIHGSLIPTVCGYSVEQMHQISAPLGPVGSQLGSGGRTNTYIRSEIPRRETRAESSQENREQDSPNPRVITED